MGTHLATHLLQMCTYLIELLLVSLANISRDIICLPPHFYRPLSKNVETIPTTTLPTAIIPLLTPHAFELAEYLANSGIKAFAVVFPVVPKDKARVRVTVNADKTREDIDRLVSVVVEWAKAMDMPSLKDKAISCIGPAKVKL